MSLSVEFLEHPGGSRSLGAVETYDSGSNLFLYDFNRSRVAFGVKYPYSADTREIAETNDVTHTFHLKTTMVRSAGLTGTLYLQVCHQDLSKPIYETSRPVTDVPTTEGAVLWSLPKIILYGAESDYYIVVRFTISQADADAGEYLRFRGADGTGYRQSSSGNWSTISDRMAFKLGTQVATYTPTVCTNLNFSLADAANVADGSNYITREDAGAGTIYTYNKYLRFKLTNNGVDLVRVKGIRLYRSDGITANTSAAGAWVRAQEIAPYETPTRTPADVTDLGETYETGIRVHEEDPVADAEWHLAAGATFTTSRWTELTFAVTKDAPVGVFPPGGPMVFTLAWDEW